MFAVPELVEVETIKNVLAPQLCGRRITGLWLERPEIVAHPDADTACARLRNARMEALGRRGKYLTFALSTGDTLVLHLRMTGQLLYTPPCFPDIPYTRAVFSLDDGGALRFADLRRFGRIWLLCAGETDTFTGMKALGPEPFDPGADAAYLSKMLGKSRRALKACLLDQHVLAGVGNIYADEILFAARLHPALAACMLDLAQWETLAAAIPIVLKDNIEKNRISPDAYLRSLGREYRNTPFFNVYGRAGKPCVRCGAALARMTVSGRGSCFCPHCQNLPGSAEMGEKAAVQSENTGKA